MLTVKQVRDVLGTSVQTVSKNKEGYIVVRRGFFYTHGCDADKFATRIMDNLQTAGVQCRLIDSGEVHKPFRGSANTANSSHWFAVLA